MLRATLGDFNSIVCFKSVITGMEEALGEKATSIALIAAGRTRGKNLTNSLGLAGSNIALEDIASKLNSALGVDGTRLCIIDKVEKTDDLIAVYTRETICSAGEEPGSPRKCTYTLGVVWGALENIYGKRYRGFQKESVLRGGTHDVFEFNLILKGMKIDRRTLSSAKDGTLSRSEYSTLIRLRDWVRESSGNKNLCIDDILVIKEEKDD